MERRYYTKKDIRNAFGELFRFAVITEEQEKAILEVPVERFFISNSSVKKICDILEISKETSAEELRAVRNGFVDLFGEKAQNFRNIENEAFWKVFDEYQTRISAVTSVIDSILFAKGQEV